MSGQDHLKKEERREEAKVEGRRGLAVCGGGEDLVVRSPGSATTRTDKTSLISLLQV